MSTQILFADDHTLFREFIKEVLPRKEESYKVIGEAADGEETLILVARHRPDLLLLDYKMPRLGRLSTFCQKVARHSPTTRILIMSGYAERGIALEAAIGGAQGYIWKGAPLTDLLSAIATVQAGRIWIDPRLPISVSHAFLSWNLSKRRNGTKQLQKLTRQELQILSLVAQGMRNKEIATHLYISVKTVKNHLTHIFAKLQVNGRQQAAQFLRVEKKGAV